MGIEDRISELLQAGATPAQLIRESGFSKSTVYKVAEGLRAQQGRSPNPLWTINTDAARDRYLPGEVAVLTFTITNNSNADLYVFQAGVQPEWLMDSASGTAEWIFSVQRKLVRPTERLAIRLSVPIPGSESLGEKDVMFGIEGQWLAPMSAPSSNGMMWAGPSVLKVQHPRNGRRIFLSHSVRDMHLINELGQTLDNYGVEPVIAENIVTPGAVLPEKFASLIDQSDVVVALLTDQSIRSKWVIAEVQHAVAIGKPRVLLRDQSVRGVASEIDHIEWTDIDVTAGVEAIAAVLAGALQQLPQTAGLAHRSRKSMDDVAAVVLVALLIFVIGLTVAKARV